MRATARRLGRPPRDQDYPPWILSSIPTTPDRTEDAKKIGPSSLPYLLNSIHRLCGTKEIPGADFVIIACNTAHMHLEQLRSVVQIPVLDMINETVREASQRLGPTSIIGVLATTGTLKEKLYSKAAKGFGRRTISLLDLKDPEGNDESLQENLIMEPIYGQLQNGIRSGNGIKSYGKATREEIDKLLHAAQILVEYGAEIILTACTEISLALRDLPNKGFQVLDPLDVVADISVDIASGERPLPSESSTDSKTKSP